jgi:hypothetical protein
MARKSVVRALRPNRVPSMATTSSAGASQLGRPPEAPRRDVAGDVPFMEEVARTYPDGTVHVIWDNLNTHRAYGVWKSFNARYGERSSFISPRCMPVG